MTFVEHYNQAKAQQMPPTPASIFIKKIAKLTHRSEVTVRTWANGKKAPDINVQNVLSAHFNEEPSELFPPKDDER